MEVGSHYPGSPDVGRLLTDQLILLDDFVVAVHALNVCLLVAHGTHILSFAPSPPPTDGEGGGGKM